MRVGAPFSTTMFPMILTFRMKAITVARCFCDGFVITLLRRLDSIRIQQRTTIFYVSYRFTICPCVMNELGPFRVGRSVRTFPTDQSNRLTSVDACKVMIDERMKQVKQRQVANVYVSEYVRTLRFPTSQGFGFAPLTNARSKLIRIFKTRIVIL